VLKPTKPKVLVAMSGGVDSSVAAAMLVREGYDVVGCFMRLGSPGESLDGPVLDDGACDTRPAAPGETIKHRGCCSVGDAADARLVAAELGVPFYVCNFKKDFGRIIDYFVDEYASGRTPNPCVRCNDWLKFVKLHEYAKSMDASFVASGHYARISERDGGRALLRGVDASKDQSYVLFGSGREQLAEMMLPIGEMEKPRVRELAEQYGLPVFDKPDSQEICFVPDDDYAGLVERRKPELAKAGAIVNEAGEKVGEHAGQHRFTIGQRRGVGVALGHPIYVIDKDPQTNTVTIGSNQSLAAVSCKANELNWLLPEPPADDWTPCFVQHRYNGDAVRAVYRRTEDTGEEVPSGRRGAIEVRFEQPQRAVTPGQALVVYGDQDRDRVLGGGWIVSKCAEERPEGACG